MHKLSSKKEQQAIDVIENLLVELTAGKIETNIVGYLKLPEADQDFILKTEDGDILLKLAEIVEADYASPLSKKDSIAGKYGQFIHNQPGETPWAIDPVRLDTSIKQHVKANNEKHDVTAGFKTCWLLVYSLSAFPQTETCMRGISKVSPALTTARDYLKSLDQVIFDQIWYTNLMTRPVQVWPYTLGATLC